MPTKFVITVEEEDGLTDDECEALLSEFEEVVGKHNYSLYDSSYEED